MNTMFSSTRPPERGRAGFTLVELLVVIGIIAILMGILLPSLARAMSSAREIQCMSNLRQWGLGFVSYANQFNGLLPADSGDGTSSNPVGNWEDSSLWFNALPPLVSGSPYCELNDPTVGKPPGIGSANIFICPSIDSVAGASGDATQLGEFFTIYGKGPSGGGVQPRPMLMSYVMNSKLMNSSDHGMKLTKLQPSSAWILLVEMRANPGELPKTDANYTKTLAQLHSDRKRFAARHHGGKYAGGHLLFADGHVEFATNREVNMPCPSAKGTDYNYPGQRMWDTHGAAQ